MCSYSCSFVFFISPQSKIKHRLLHLQIIEKVGLIEELFLELKKWMVSVVLPKHQNSIGYQNEQVGTNHLVKSAGRISDMRNLILKLVEKVIDNPAKVGIVPKV